jgi:hypothetical protein
MSEWTGNYKEYASNADSKYSIGFAEADLNCIKGIRLWPKGSKKKCGYDEVDLTGKVVIEYTDYCYENPRGEIDPGPYNKVASNPDKYLYPDPLYYIKGDPNPVCPTVSPFSDPTGQNHEPKKVYMTGKEYAALGCCKALEDLPVCLSVEMRVDIFPSIDAIGIPDDQVIKPDCPTPISYNGECRQYEAKVFAGDEPAQAVTWSIEGGTSKLNKISSTDPGGDMTYYKAKFCVANDELAEQVQVKACSTFDNKVCGYSVVRLKPRIVLKVPEGIDGFSPCQIIDINAWIFGGGNYQDLDVTVTGGADANTRIIKNNDGKFQLQVSCNEPNIATTPLTLRACDITGHNFVPALEPAGNGGCETFQLPRKWISIEAGSSTESSAVAGTNPNSVSCATCGSASSPGYAPCGNTTTYKAWMNWGQPCPRRQNITDKVAWTVEGAVNSNTTISVSGTGAAAIATFRRGGNIYSTTRVDVGGTNSSSSNCVTKTTQVYISGYGYVTISYQDCSETDSYTPNLQYILVEPCEAGTVKIVATSSEQIRGTLPAT